MFFDEFVYDCVYKTERIVVLACFAKMTVKFIVYCRWVSDELRIVFDILKWVIKNASYLLDSDEFKRFCFRILLKVKNRREAYVFYFQFGFIAILNLISNRIGFAIWVYESRLDFDFK